MAVQTLFSNSNTTTTVELVSYTIVQKSTTVLCSGYWVTMIFLFPTHSCQLIVPFIDWYKNKESTTNKRQLQINTDYVGYFHHFDLKNRYYQNTDYFTVNTLKPNQYNTDITDYISIAQNIQKYIWFIKYIMIHIHIKQYPNNKHCCDHDKHFIVRHSTLKITHTNKIQTISHVTCGITISTGIPNPVISFIACYLILVMNISEVKIIWFIDWLMFNANW